MIELTTGANNLAGRPGCPTRLLHNRDDKADMHVVPSHSLTAGAARPATGRQVPEFWERKRLDTRRKREREKEPSTHDGAVVGLAWLASVLADQAKVPCLCTARRWEPGGRPALGIIGRRRDQVAGRVMAMADHQIKE
jgi:hypothetical protein